MLFSISSTGVLISNTIKPLKLPDWRLGRLSYQWLCASYQHFSKQSWEAVSV